MKQTLSSKHKGWLFGCLALLVVLGGGLLLLRYQLFSTASDHREDEVAALLSYKTAYVGNNSKVANLIKHLPFGKDWSTTIALQTRRPPYVLTINYLCNSLGNNELRFRNMMRRNAVLLFALIANVDQINIRVLYSDKECEYPISRAVVQECFREELRQYSQNRERLAILIQSLEMTVAVSPDPYTPIMSSIPGIRIHAKAPGKYAKVCYTAGSGGAVFTWDVKTGRISKQVKALTVARDLPVYWAPDRADKLSPQTNSVIDIALLTGEDKVVAEKRVTVVARKNNTYGVKSALGIQYRS